MFEHLCVTNIFAVMRGALRKTWKDRRTTPITQRHPDIRMRFRKPKRMPKATPRIGARYRKCSLAPIFNKEWSRKA